MYRMDPKDVPLEFPDGSYNHAEERPWRRSSAVAVRPTAGQRFDEAAPLVAAPPVYGPPVALILGTWLLLVLLVIPPAALLITLVLVAAAPVVVLVALVAPPYLLVRHLRKRREARQRHRVASADRTAHQAPAHPKPVVADVPGPHGWRPVGAHLVPLATK
jgi:hypothetical protein